MKGLLLLAVLLATPAGAQEIELTLMARIDGRDGIGLTNPLVLGSDRDGRWYITEMDQPVDIYSPAGNYVATIGTEGEGPNQYESVSAFAVMGDELFLFDSATGRATVVDHRTLEELRTFPLTGVVLGALADHDGTLILNLWEATSAQAGFALARLTADGESLTRFDDTPFAGRGTQLNAARRRVLGTSDTHGFWSGWRFSKYDVARYVGDVRTQHFTGEAWAYEMPTVERPPGTTLVAVWEADGVLWTVKMVAAEDWTRGLGERKTLKETGEDYYPVERVVQVFDTLIEARDPIAGEVLATRREDWIPTPGPVGAVVQYEETDLGSIVLTMYQPSFKE